MIKDKSGGREIEEQHRNETSNFRDGLRERTIK